MIELTNPTPFEAPKRPTIEEQQAWFEAHTSDEAPTGEEWKPRGGIGADVFAQIPGVGRTAAEHWMGGDDETVFVPEKGPDGRGIIGYSIYQKEQHPNPTEPESTEAAVGGTVLYTVGIQDPTDHVES